MSAPALPAAFLLIDRDLSLVAVSPTAVPLLGRPVRELLGRPLREALPDPRVDTVANDIFRGHSTDIAFEVQISGLFEEVQLQVDFAQLLARSDFPLVVVGLTDLASLQQARQELEQTQDRLSRLLHHLPCMAIRCLASPGLPIREVDGGVAELGGLDVGTLPGSLLSDLLAVHSALELEDAVAEARSNGKPVQCVVELRDSGASLDLQGRVFQSDDETWFEAFVTDVSERRELERQLLHSQKMEVVGRLAGALAHDFNNLLAVVLSRCDLMLIRAHDDPALQNGLSQVRGAAERAAGMIRQLQGLAAANPADGQRADATAVLERTLGLLRPLFQENHDLVAEQLTDVGWVATGEDRLEQLLLNLVLNAREAMRGSGTVEIRLSHRQEAIDGLLGAGAPGPLGLAVLEVQDNGPGMDRLTAERAFDPYFTTRKGRGTGLGLSIVHGIVMEAGGDIRLETAPGRGTRFTVALPLVLAPRAVTPVLDTVAAAPRRARILVVDDDEGVRGVTVDLLEAAGHEVRDASSGEEGLALADAHRFDLVLTDVVMPGMGGRRLADLLRQHHPGLPVLFMSGHADDDVLAQGVAAGRERLLRKPFRLEALMEAVGAALDP